MHLDVCRLHTFALAALETRNHESLAVNVRLGKAVLITDEHLYKSKVSRHILHANK